MKDLMMFCVSPEEIQAGIDNGTQDLIQECPIAMTLKKRYPDAKQVEVHGDNVEIDGEIWEDNDGMLVDFISVFDNDDRDREDTELLEFWLEHGCPMALRRNDDV